MSEVKALIDTGTEAGALAASICLPDEYEPVRVSSNFRNTPVALSKPFQELKYTWSQAQTEGWLPASEACVILFRNAALHFIRYHGSAPSAFTYHWCFDKLGGTPTTFIILGSAGNWWLEPQYATADAANTYAAHGPVLPSGTHEGHHYIWMDAGINLAVSTVTVTLAVAPVLGDVGYIELMHWHNGVVTQSTQTPMGVGFTIYTLIPAQTGYFSVRVVKSAGPTDLLSCTISHTTDAGCPVAEHHPLAGYVENAARVGKYAITTTSVLWRNTSSFENASGDYATVQIPGGQSWTDVVSPLSAGYNALAAAHPNGWESRFAAKGTYTYLKPEDEDDIDFMSSTLNSPTDWMTMNFPLISPTAFMILVASVAVAAARESSLRIVAHVEYQTTDSWADVRPSENLVDTWVEAAKILNYLPQSSENPSHFTNLLTRIGQAGKTAMSIVDKGLGSSYAGKIPIVKEGLGLIKGTTVPILKRGFQLIEDQGRGNFKGATWDDVRIAIQRMDPRQGFDSYKM